MITRAIVIMGVSGCGKSSLGRLIADRLAIRFLEGDDFHPPANIAKMAAGIPLDDDDRWPWLDDVGAAIYASAQRYGCAVASCSALKRSYRDRLRKAAQAPLRFVCLTGDGDLLTRRMLERSGHYMPLGLLATQLAILEMPGRDEDAVIVDIAMAPERQVEAALGCSGGPRRPWGDWI